MNPGARLKKMGAGLMRIEKPGIVLVTICFDTGELFTRELGDVSLEEATRELALSVTQSIRPAGGVH